ncbi:uncharacterized protein LOC106473840 [Limulus polyphemus]|uniref:Uncharacterized protein LOC106473840 n=1 Tax=Limulus polyphemus TaxID=6850 RepID=A0ABM1BWF3_LIMPO|nr:uncharacterized protein LOC106473840 [Limulus polyphemus]
MTVAKEVIHSKENILQEIDQEIQVAYEYHLKNGYTPEEIQKAAKPLLEPLRRGRYKKRLVFLVKVTLVLLVIYMLLSADPVYRRLCMYGRLFLFQVLPFWDWTEMYYSSCFIYNPFFSKNKLTESDCQVCEDITEIERFNQTSPDEVAEHLLKNDIPLIVMEGTNNWPIMEETFSLANLSEGYLDDPRINSVGVCMFQTNLRFHTPQKFLQKLKQNPHMDRWYVHWENCEKATEKFLRKFYRRPYFIPPMLEMIQSNWIMMSFNYKGRLYKKIQPPTSTTVMWLAQVRGYHHIRLKPKKPCNNLCENLEDVLEEGDVLLFPVTLWKLEYLPGEKSENLAIGGGGYFQ